MTLSHLNYEGSVWFFDYDLNLYPHTQMDVLLSLHPGMNEFVSEALGVDPGQAQEVRVRYWKKYGTTLAGLIAKHGIDPDKFFDFVHGHPELVMPRHDPGIMHAVSRVRGQRHVFSNSRSDWVIRGLEAMGMSELFQKIFGVNHFRWKCKPNPEPYAELEKEFGEPEQLILLDDSAINLATARDRGWNTVWVHPQANKNGKGPWTLEISSLDQLTHHI